MEPDIARRLLDLNAQFYQTFANQFSQTRQRLQPGVLRLLPDLLKQARILDLGCGNGELARKLAQEGFAGQYTGLDFSPGLLDHARQNLPPGFEGSFLQADVSTAGWESGLPWETCTAVLAFAVLHHLPGEKLRLELLGRVRALLEPGGSFIHSNWQFLRSERLKARIQPWEKIGLGKGDLDPGDYLLDWRRGGTGLRYVHHFDEQELAALARQTGFRVRDTFYADGQTGDLGLYMWWEAV